MALIVSAATGNFNAGSTWVGGVVPTVGDEARAATGHTITITANVTCDEISNAGTGKFIINDGITLTANVTNKSATSGNLLELTSTNSATIVGNILSRGTQNATYTIANLGTGTLTITGTVTGNDAVLGSGSRNCILNNSSGVINVTGDVNGGTGTTANNVIINNATGTITITGNVTATTNTSSTIFNNSTGTISVVGNITAGAVSAISSSNFSSTVKISGNFIHSATGVVPVFAQKFILNTTPTAAKTRYALNGLGTYVDMFTADNTGFGPATNHVRAGVTYSGMTGTLAVPLPSQVSVGVATDNTVGTAYINAADVATAVWGAATRTTTGGTVDTLTNAPSVPSASAIASQVRTELSVELARIDAATSTRATPANIPTSDITAIKAKTDALNTTRLAQVSTTEIVGNLLAQANS